MTEKELKNGAEFIFNNHDFCAETQTDDFRGGRIFWNKKTGFFVVEFNGAFVHLSKTYPPARRKLDQLFIKWNLKIKTKD